VIYCTMCVRSTLYSNMTDLKACWKYITGAHLLAFLML